MQSVNLTVELVNAILGYLGTKPFTEVAQLINAVQTQVAPQVQQEAPAEPAESTVQ